MCIIFFFTVAIWLFPTTQLFLWKMAEANLFLLERTYALFC